MSTMALPLPEKQGCSKYVSFELRNGTCVCLFAIAVRTSASEDSDLLMLHVSFSLPESSPSSAQQAADLALRSDPLASSSRPHTLAA